MIAEQPVYFTLGMALYRPDGTKIGLVTRIDLNWQGYRGVERASCRTIEDTTVTFVSDMLKNGEIMGRKELRKRSIPRQSDYYFPPTLNIGSRLYEGNVFIGAVNRVEAVPMSPGGFICITDYQQAAGYLQFYTGKVHIGRRTHAA